MAEIERHIESVKQQYSENQRSQDTELEKEKESPEISIYMHSENITQVKLSMRISLYLKNKLANNKNNKMRKS